MDLKGKRVLVIGERDGIAGTSVAKCVESAGGKPELILTQCFV